VAASSYVPPVTTTSTRDAYCAAHNDDRPRWPTVRLGDAVLSGFPSGPPNGDQTPGSTTYNGPRMFRWPPRDIQPPFSGGVGQRRRRGSPWASATLDVPPPIDPATQRAQQPGQPGLAVVTNLLNEAMPFIRYVPGDYVTRPAVEAACRVGWSQVSHVDGRINDSFVNRDGKMRSLIDASDSILAEECTAGSAGRRPGRFCRQFPADAQVPPIRFRSTPRSGVEQRRDVRPTARRWATRGPARPVGTSAGPCAAPRRPGSAPPAHRAAKSGASRRRAVERLWP
jgi:hypothetical protein